MGDVFISYSRKDNHEGFVTSLFERLQADKIDAWLDTRNIPPAFNFIKEIKDSIDAADYFLFILSPNSVASEYCMAELDHANQNGKMLIPVVREDVPGDNVPEVLAKLNWIFLRPTDSFEENYSKLLSALSTADQDYVHTHTRLLMRAREWETRKRPTGFLLHGNDLEDAENWRDNSAGKRPSPTLLHIDYINAGRRAADARRRVIIASILIAMVAMSVLAVVGFTQRNLAVAKAAHSESQRLAAHANNILKLDDGNVETAALLGIRALNTAYSDEAYAVLGRAVDRLFTLHLLRVASVHSARYSPDGQRIVTTSKDGTAHIWNALTGAQLAVLVGHKDIVWNARFSPDGQRIVTTSIDGTARIWNASTGAQLAVLTEPQFDVWDASFSPDGTRVITTPWNTPFTSVQIWDPLTERQIATMNDPTNTMHHAFFGLNGQMIRVNDNGTAQVWDIVEGKLITTLTGLIGSVRNVIFGPNRKWLLTASDNSTVQLWNVETGAQMTVLAGYKGWIYDASLSPNGNLIATVNLDEKMARVWNARTGVQIGVLIGHKYGLNSVEFSSDGQHILTSSEDGTERIWLSPENDHSSILMGHTGGVASAAFSPDGEKVVSASDDGTARVWKIATGETVAVLTGHTKHVVSSIFSPDSARILTSSIDDTVRVWDANTGDPLAILPGHGGLRELEFRFSLDSKQVLTASEGKVTLWDATTGKKAVVFGSDNEPVQDAVYSSDRKRIATTGMLYNVIIVWDALSRKQIVRLQTTGMILSGALSSDGELLVTDTEDGISQVWNATTGEQIAHFGPPKGRGVRGITSIFSPDGKHILTREANVASIWDSKTGAETAVLNIDNNSSFDSAVFSPDGKYIATAGADQTARIWDATTGAQITVLRGHTNTVTSVAFSPDGQKVVTASNDGTVRVWYANSSDLVSYACIRVFSDFTTSERALYEIKDEAPTCPNLAKLN